MWNAHKTKILSAILFLSLAGNIGLASWMAGKKAGELGNSRRTRIEAFTDIARTLPPEQRKAALQSIKTHRPQLKQAMRSVRDQRQAILVLAQQDQVNPQKLEEALAELRRRTTAAQEEGHALALEIIPYVPPEQRRALIEKQAKLLR